MKPKREPTKRPDNIFPEEEWKKEHLPALFKGKRGISPEKKDPKEKGLFTSVADPLSFWNNY